MFTTKKEILQLVALMHAHGIRQVVLCPGSRNIPLTQAIVRSGHFTCHAVTDERSAGFFALGLSLHGGAPAAVVCATGSALLNLHPAVAEAYRQQVSLVVISADYPAVHTEPSVPKAGVFGMQVKASVSLPQVRNDEDEWLCNRLINEALMEVSHHGRGPVHINVPVGEPLFDEADVSLPQPRVITRYEGLNVYNRDYQPLIDRLNRYQKRLAVVGQMNLIYLFDKRFNKMLGKQFAWLTENLSNSTIPGQAIRRIDELLYPLDLKTLDNLRPELLITYGGHIVSRRLKYFLRKHPPVEHWHVAKDGQAPDLCQGALTTVIEMDPFEFLERIAPLIEGVPPQYPRLWEQLAERLPQPQFPYSAMSAVGSFINSLPEACALHLANGSAVSYAQMFAVPDGVEVLANLGTGGVEGTLSTALGYATASSKLNFIIVGDLGFFSGMNALWNTSYGSNVRILLLNNGGAEAVHSLPRLHMDDADRRFITGSHHATARAWAEDRGFQYLAATMQEELEQALPTLMQPSITSKPILLEVFTDGETDARLLKEHYQQLRK